MAGARAEREYRDNVVHYNWHWFWNWGTGELGNNGIHSLDLCRWGLGVDFPRRVVAGGGKYFFDDDQETPDTHTVTYDFGDKCIIWEGRNWHPRGLEDSTFGYAFYGDRGALVCDGKTYRVFDQSEKEIASQDKGFGGHDPHLLNFLSCIRSGTARPPISRKATRARCCATWATSPIAPATRSTSTPPTASRKTTPPPPRSGAASTAPAGSPRCRVVRSRGHDQFQ